MNPIRTTSLKATTQHTDESLDFVFIDASHQYEDVINHLRTWYPKVKKGGYIGGHDFIIVHLGVFRAVKEFFGTACEVRRNSFFT
ncbi:MAG: class I SAM-dependent methyltransferase [Flavobacteriaceae bacterium]|nr:class I SAM-dependent methyltransferase [Flavobacteriaceae bacterium]